jgi:hypothetical protein
MEFKEFHKNFIIVIIQNIQWSDVIFIFKKKSRLLLIEYTLDDE